jgi:hypothetical protein
MASTIHRAQPLKFVAAAGDEQGMARVLMTAVLLAIPLVASWILVRRVPHPVSTKRYPRR